MIWRNFSMLTPRLPASSLFAEMFLSASSSIILVKSSCDSCTWTADTFYQTECIVEKDSIIKWNLVFAANRLKILECYQGVLDLVTFRPAQQSKDSSKRLLWRLTAELTHHQGTKLFQSHYSVPHNFLNKGSIVLFWFGRVKAQRYHCQVHLVLVNGATTICVKQVEDFTYLCFLRWGKRYVVTLNNISSWRRWWCWM